MPYGLSDKNINSILDVFRANSRVEEVILFGSRAMGNYKKASDIDLALKGNALTFDDVLAIQAQLEDLPLAYKFDVLDYSAISNKKLMEHIDEFGVDFYKTEAIKEGWQLNRVGEIADIIMGQSPSGASCNGNMIGIPLLNGPTEFGTFNPVPVQYTTDPKKICNVDDILFCVRGSTTGKMNWANQKYAIGRGLAAIRHKKGRKYKYFLKGLIDYNLRGLLAISTGSTFPNISKEQLSNFEVVIPSDLNEQSRIASILSSIDEKIELNLQMNKTLEDMAQAIFKEWFVKFNFPGFDGKLVDELPKGWYKGRIDDLFILQRGFDLPSTQRTEGHFPVVAASGISSFHSEYKVKGPGVTTGRSGVIGNVFYILDDFWPLNTSLYVKEFKVATPVYAFYVLKSMDLSQLNGGSAVPTLNRNDVHSLATVVPEEKIIERFQTIAGQLLAKVAQNNEENKVLSEIRDNLLPKLMSGKITVPA